MFDRFSQCFKGGEGIGQVEVEFFKRDFDVSLRLKSVLQMGSG